LRWGCSVLLWRRRTLCTSAPTLRSAPAPIPNSPGCIHTAVAEALRSCCTAAVVVVRNPAVAACILSALAFRASYLALTGRHSSAAAARHTAAAGAAVHRRTCCDTPVLGSTTWWSRAGEVVGRCLHACAESKPRIGVAWSTLSPKAEGDNRKKGGESERKHGGKLRCRVRSSAADTITSKRRQVRAARGGGVVPRLRCPQPSTSAWDLDRRQKSKGKDGVKISRGRPVEK
jgi:hypothetical protein